MNTTFLLYVLAFAAAAVACFLSLVRVSEIVDRDTRRGLAALLLTSGGWATAHVAYLLVPSETLKYAFYLVGLMVGFSAVGPWLYFCSAYTGRTLHRSSTLRRLAVGSYLAIVAVKVTNPLHELYFTTEFVASPFPHLAVQHGMIHWVVMGGAYALAIVGYFMLLELFTKVGYDATPLIALIGVTGLPILFDVVGYASPLLLDMTYEPIGVAVFAVGLLFVFSEQFQAVQFTGERDDPAIFLAEDRRIRDYNRAAVDLFPQLRDGTGEQLEEVVPELAEPLASDHGIVTLQRGGKTRFYQIGRNPFQFGKTRIGELVSLSDVTDSERHRRKLERQNERLDRFASVVSHDLRNPLNVAQGRLEMERERRDSENLEVVARSLDRMETLIEDVLSLARQGKDVGDVEAVTLRESAEEAWSSVHAEEAEMVVADDLAFRADPDRLRQLFENLFRNAVEHGGADVTIAVGPLDGGFYVEDDGAGIPEEVRENLFEPGNTSSATGTGFGLAIVKEIAEAHGWSVAATDADGGGARFEVHGVDAE